MEHLSLEIFDREGTGSQFATLPDNTEITITDTSEVFASGDVWSWDFQLNTNANLHIFGTSGELHGQRLHEAVNKRRARLWVEGLPLYLGYLKLADEVDVDGEGNVSVSFESGQKTFDEMIDGVKATEVSVGDVVIGVALNRKRVVQFDNKAVYVLTGLKPYAVKDAELEGVDRCHFAYINTTEPNNCKTPYTQRWPKMVKSHGKVWNGSWGTVDADYTNVQTAYDKTPEHSFCNINICYPFKSVDAGGEELAGRGYTVRLAHGKPTTDGGDDQTRYNNAPNFYLLYFIDRLFKDMNIHITENQAYDVEDLRRVFMLNYGCHYEEIENDNEYYHSTDHATPADRTDIPFTSRYGQYYMPIVDETDLQGNITEQRLLTSWDDACKAIKSDESTAGKVLLRDVKIIKGDSSTPLKELGSVEGVAYSMIEVAEEMGGYSVDGGPFSVQLVTTYQERIHKAYSAYLAYATGDNYPNVEISEVIAAMKSMFGVRLLFSGDYSTVRIVLLRNLFRDTDVQDVACEIVDNDEKMENCIRGFRMTYSKGSEDTSFYYKGFNDLFSRAATIWKDTADRHDYSQWDLNAIYDEIKQSVSAFNRKCYVTPTTGNAYIIKVDENEDVLFPSLSEAAPFMDAEDGDCSQPESEGKTVEEVQCGASPVIMNDVNNTYASLFSGDLKAPTPAIPSDLDPNRNKEHPALGQKIATFGRATKESTTPAYGGNGMNNAGDWFKVTGQLDVFISEGFRIRMEDNYGISNGGTPFDEADPGLQFGIMRGSGDDSFIDRFDDFDDGEGNDAWDIEPGTGAVAHPDTCDCYGNLWDYNGDTAGVGTTEGRVSLKLRAEKPNPYFDPTQPEDSSNNRRYLEITAPGLEHRGLADQFYMEYSHWVRNARIAVREVRMELAQLLCIDKTKRVRVGDVTGFIRKMQYSVSKETGLGNVTMEIMYI